MAKIAELIREQVTSFLASIKLGDEPLDGNKTLVDGVLLLVDKLKAHQEEGKELRPEVFVFREKDHAALDEQQELLHLFEVAHQEGRALASFAKAVKHCAPLATGVWAAFIKLRDADLAYGVVRRRYTVTDERLVLNDATSPPFVWLRQLERHVVELRGPDGARTEIDFRATSMADSEAPAAREALLATLTQTGFDAHKAGVRSFLEDVFDRAMLYGHGFLVAISAGAGAMNTPALLKAVPPKPAFADGLRFRGWVIPTPLKVAEFRDWQLAGERPDEKANKTAEEIATEVARRCAEVEAWLDLAASMLMSDGITWFDNAGRVLGYRMFVPHLGLSNDGGARTRAFEELKKHVGAGKELLAVYMQSQDGHASFYRG